MNMMITEVSWLSLQNSQLMKEDGNKRFTDGDYRLAVHHYTLAVGKEYVAQKEDNIDVDVYS